jgi:phage-related protein
MKLFYILIKGSVIVILHMYKKQSQKAPKKEIALSEKRMKEVVENEKDYLK